MQCEEARRRALEQHLEDMVEIRSGDHRMATGLFDGWVAIEVLDKLPVRQFRRFFEQIAAITKPGARGVLQVMGRKTGGVPAQIDHLTFGESLPTPEEIEAAFRPAGFACLQRETIHDDYARTLDHWGERLERNRDVVDARYGSRFLRLCLLGIRGTAARLRHGRLGAYRLVLRRL